MNMSASFARLALFLPLPVALVAYTSAQPPPEGIEQAGVAARAAPVLPCERDFREDMRDFVRAIAEYARITNPDFLVVPQNGQELISQNGESDGPLAEAYADAIDGQGREDLFYGYESDNEPTPAADRDYLIGFLDRAEGAGVQALVTDYCSTPAYIDNSYAWNAARGYTSFAATHRELDNIPVRPTAPFDENTGHVDTLADARNLLYLLNPVTFSSKQAYLDTLAGTNFDLFIIDLFFEDEALSASELAALHAKANGGRRIILAYMSIGEAEDYRFYWQPGWSPGGPGWMERENPDFAGNFKVRYWDQEWQDLIFGRPDAYLDRILAAGFDGVYLDIIDAFEYFEERCGVGEGEDEKPDNGPACAASHAARPDPPWTDATVVVGVFAGLCVFALKKRANARR